MKPIIELHVHLEGAIPIPALAELVKKYGGTGDDASVDGLKKRFVYRDFPHFIECWNWKNGFLREYEDFAFIADEFAGNLNRQGVSYCEAFYSPGHFERTGLEVQRITGAIREGLDRHREHVVINLVADLVRDHGPQKGDRWLSELHEVQGLGVIGVGIGGSEQRFPPAPYADAFERARNLGFRTSAHAGEAAGPDSIWGAIKKLRVDRIGHGTRAVEDPVLVEYIADHQIPIEMCPVSNLRTGVVASIESHPIRRFFELGIPVSVNTDDPEMFDTSLAHEYAELQRALGFSAEDVRLLIGNAIEMAWCDAATKARLHEYLQGESAP